MAVEIGTDIRQSDDFDDTALIQAVDSGNEEIVSVLLKAGADVSQGCKLGTPLSHACNREVAMLLLEAGEATHSNSPPKGDEQFWVILQNRISVCSRFPRRSFASGVPVALCTQPINDEHSVLGQTRPVPRSSRR